MARPLRMDCDTPMAFSSIRPTRAPTTPAKMDPVAARFGSPPPRTRVLSIAKGVVAVVGTRETAKTEESPQKRALSARICAGGRED